MPFVGDEVGGPLRDAADVPLEFVVRGSAIFEFREVGFEEGELVFVGCGRGVLVCCLDREVVE